MKKTPARVQFKKHFGQANHHLITTLVALHHLNNSAVYTAPEELRAAWNPKDRTASVNRSRIFVLQSFLGWAVDSVDMYLSLLNRKPNFLQNPDIPSALNDKKAGRSVRRKVEVFSNYYASPPTLVALLDILITWRNNIFHEITENHLLIDTRGILAANSPEIEITYRGLVVDGLADKAEKGSPLTFKETASLINATHMFVEKVDEAVLSTFNPVTFCKDAIADALNDKDNGTSFAAKYHCLPQEKRRRFVRNWLQNTFGVCGLEDKTLNECLELKRDIEAN